MSTKSLLDKDDSLAIALIALYFTIHFIIRITAPGALELDEAAELIRTQEWRLGYGTQPPLYTWLLFPLMQVFGPNIWALALLKNLLLFGTYAYVYGIGRRLGLMPTMALLASASLLLFPQIGWESQRDLTHSVLATHAAAGALFLTLGLLREPTVKQYLLLGCYIAVGLLAKYNFAVFLVALALAALTHPKTRIRVLDARLLLTVGLALLFLLPHLYWLADNGTIAFSGSMQKMGVDDHGGILTAWTALIDGFLQFTGLALLVSFLLLPLRKRTSDFQVPISYLHRYLFVVILILFVIAALLGMDKFKDRWFQPLLFVLPPLVLATFSVKHLPTWRTKAYLAVIAVLVSGVYVGMLIQVHLSPWVSKPTRLAVPFEEIVKQIPLPKGATVGSNDVHLAGGLKLHRPDLNVNLPRFDDANHQGTCFLVSTNIEKMRSEATQRVTAQGDALPAETALADVKNLEIPYPGNADVYPVAYLVTRCRTSPQ